MTGWIWADVVIGAFVLIGAGYLSILVAAAFIAAWLYIFMGGNK